MRLTQKQARDQLYQTVVPNLSTPENIAEINKFLNLVQERFINSGKWTGMIHRVRFTLPEFYITLPRRYVSALAVRFDKDGCSAPVFINNQWWQYVVGGPGCLCDENQADTWYRYGFYTSLVDEGDGWPIFRNAPYENYYLKVTSTNVSDAGKVLNFKGEYNGKEIFTDAGSTSYLGVNVTMVNGSVTTTQIFNKQVTFVSKDITEGYVEVRAVDVLTGEETLIGNYEPTETTISYRRYRLAVPPNQLNSVTALCKIRYVPAIADTDEIIPANLGALTNGLMALKYEQQGDKERYEQFFTSALQLLNNEAREERGGAQFKINISPTAISPFRLRPGY